MYEFESNAERIYNTRKPRSIVEMEKEQERLVRMYNDVFFKIEKMKTVKDYIQTRNMLNAFAHMKGSNSVEVYKLHKKLKGKLTQMLDDNNNKIEKLQNEIENIKFIRVTESSEKIKDLETQSNAVLYEYMAQLHANGINSNSDKRRIGSWAKNPTRTEALALQKLFVLSQYAGLFTEKMRDNINAAARNPDAVAHEKAMQPLLEEKGAELGRCYMESFHLKRLQKIITNDIKEMEREEV